MEIMRTKAILRPFGEERAGVMRGVGLFCRLFVCLLCAVPLLCLWGAVPSFAGADLAGGVSCGFC